MISTTDNQTTAPPAPPGGQQPALPEDARKKLDDIVMKMDANGESAANIKAVVEDFKKKYSAGSTSSVAPAKTTAPVSVTPAPPAGGYTSLKDLMKAQGIQTPVEQHDNELNKSQEHLQKTFAKIDPLAHKVVAEDKLADLQKQFSQSLNRPGADMTRANLQAPTQLPAFMAPTQQEVQQLKATPEGQRRLLARQVTEYKNEGKQKEAGELQAALYNTDRGAADTDEKARQRLDNTQALKRGELTYSPVTQRLIKLTDLGESITEAWNQRNKDIALFDAADEKDDKSLAAYLDNQLTQQADPDKPIPVPKGLAGSVGAFIGDQGPVGAVATAAGAIPVVGEAAAGGLYAHEMGRRTYGQELLRTYADLRKQHPDMAPEEAVRLAKTQAARAGVVDAVTGAALGATTGKLGKVKEGEVPGLTVAAVPKPTGMLQKAIVKGYDFLKESLPTGVKNAALFSGGQLAKNISAQQVGADRDITEGVAGAGATALGYHLAFGLLGKGLNTLTPVLKRTVLQGISKLPMSEVNAIANDQVQTGLLQPAEAQAAIKAVGEHQALDAQVPDKVKNDEVRLDLQKKLQRKQELTDELKRVNEAFHPELKEKIATLDQQIVEKANSPEAKQETPEPEPPPLLDQAADIIKGGGVKGYAAEPLKKAVNNPEQLNGFLKEIAEQPHDPKTAQATEETFGKDLTYIAKQLHPAEEVKEATQSLLESRHADTPHDEQGIVSGPNDKVLSKKGRRDANDLANDVADKGVTKIISSDLERAKETAGVVAKKTGATVEHDPALRTWDIGEFDGTKDADFKKVQEYFVDHPDATEFEGKKLGESFNQYKDRIIKARTELEKEPASTMLVNHSNNMMLWDAYEKNGRQWNEQAAQDYLKAEKPEPATLKTSTNEQVITGQRTTVRSPEIKTEPPAGGTEPGSAGGGHRPKEVRQEPVSTTGEQGAQKPYNQLKPEHVAVFADLEEAGTRKGDKARQNALNRLDKKYGAVKEKADVINEHFREIEKKLTASKVIEKICP